MNEIIDNNSRLRLIRQTFESLFGGQPTVTVRSPGRVDLMGSHTDYNDGFVLAISIDRDTCLVAAPRENSRVRIHSINMDETVEFELESRTKLNGWGRYVQSVAVTLQNAGHRLGGFDGVIHGTVPLSSGLSSSASLEATVATAFERLGEFRMDRLEKARLCQQSENEWVGMNCGILDQYLSVFGEKDKALVLDCRSLTHQLADLPTDLSLVICNTLAPRQLTESAYGERRSQCESATQFFNRLDDQVSALRDVSFETFIQHRAQLDEATARRAQFVIEENMRVLDLAKALNSNDYSAIGKICKASFVGAKDLFEITVAEMEQMYSAMSTGPGCIGCRQVGAGFGGCMIAIVDSKEINAFQEYVSNRYFAASKIRPEIYIVQPAPGSGDI